MEHAEVIRASPAKTQGSVTAAVSTIGVGLQKITAAQVVRVNLETVPPLL